MSNTLPLKKILESAYAFDNVVAGLLYFLKKVVMKTDLVRDEKESEVVRAGCREAVALLEGVAVGRDGDGDGFGDEDYDKD